MKIKEEASLLPPEDREFIDYLRGALILRVVLTHLGLSWFFLPYSSYVEIFFPALFLVSGIVTYNSFINRRTSRGKFFVKRNVNLLTTYYLISGIALLISFFLSFSGYPSLSQVIDWILINQTEEDQPYRMTQIWFLQSLVIITVLCIPFFVISEKKSNILLIPIICSLALGAAQTITPIGRNFYVHLDPLNSINIYHPLANFGYFCFGAWSVNNQFLSQISRLRYLGVICILASTSIFLIFSLEPRLSYHSFYQNLYYMLLGYAAIFLIFSFKSSLLRLIRSIAIIKIVMIFFSYHAFSIFIIHSFFIIFSENILGLKNSSAPEIIIPKIFFVLVCSCALAIPLTYIAKSTSTYLIKLLNLR